MDFARQTFLDGAQIGLPDAFMGLGFLYSTGILKLTSAWYKLSERYFYILQVQVSTQIKPKVYFTIFKLLLPVNLGLKWLLDTDIGLEWE